jgi:hypothetical protein
LIQNWFLYKYFMDGDLLIHFTALKVANKQSVQRVQTFSEIVEVAKFILWRGGGGGV